ncbi:integrase catalytic domain-containing protein [Trichonephila clavipes]|uniref:Integrase catalytic domain-containing protein n=1 Tax=Trichonephila clavipes TaxID=2585209 RepID=A0A8X6SWY4_TRICX|nr:integrase catalytic domain-containing protein [Trichonephila clavipes]
MLQNLWKLKLSWDHEIPPNCKKEFLAWLKDTSILKNVNIPRHLKVNISFELLFFVDAAGGAYAACVFVQSIIHSKVNIVLARAKSRVAPLKPLSIPRLELMACNVGVGLINSLMKALNFRNLKITFWSDSISALWWIKEKGNWSVFVSNRVKEIRLLTNTHSLKHVPGNMNPADFLPQGCSPYKLLKSKWWEGPAWSKENPENWPTGENIDRPSEINVERRKIKIVNIDLANDAPLLWHLHNTSNYSKMFKVFGWILRFINNCRKPCDKCTKLELSFYEIESFERCLIRINQKCYLFEIQLLNFGIFIDNNNILSVKTKITQRDDEESFLYPILLPRKCHFTRLLIDFVHKKVVMLEYK